MNTDKDNDRKKITTISKNVILKPSRYVTLVFPNRKVLNCF